MRSQCPCDTVTKISVDGDVAGVYDVLIAFTSDGENIWVANWIENTLSKVAQMRQT